MKQAKTVLLVCLTLTFVCNATERFIPQTLDEVKKYLCMEFDRLGTCVDKTPAVIIINKIFDFTQSEGTETEQGCYHSANTFECLTFGQLKLNRFQQCSGLKDTSVRYDIAGIQGLDVGSNKIIVGEGTAGFRGKGLRLYNSKRVIIRNLQIIDINPQVIWGGDAIELSNVRSVLIDGNYIKNIGRQMIVAHFGGNKGVTISNNVFDGNTPYSAYCDGTHYWLWLFTGEGDMITLQNNVIINTSGRGPHVVAHNRRKSLIHIVQNTFYNVKDLGLIDLKDGISSVLLEGNIFINVVKVIVTNRGNIFMPQNEADQKACIGALGRQCILNTVVNCGDATPTNSLQVLKDFKKFKTFWAVPSPVVYSQIHKCETKYLG